MFRTVLGDLDHVEGRLLTHEHLVLDLTGQKNPDVILGPDEEADVIADLVAAKGHGLGLVVDLSVPGSGRDLASLARISRASGVPVVAATGFYWDPFPRAVIENDADGLAGLMVAEITKEQQDGVRCGVIKIGTPRGEPGAEAERLFEAAAKTARRTGAAVIAHTSSPDQAAWQIQCLDRFGLAPERTLISHFGKGRFETLLEAAKSGVYLGIDQIGFASGPSYAELATMVAKAVEAGLADRLILSSDVARRTRLRSYGGTSYGTVFTHFVPHLREAGLSDALIEKMLHDNPARLLHMAVSADPTA